MQQEVEINQDYVHYMSNSDLYISHLSRYNSCLVTVFGKIFLGHRGLSNAGKEERQYVTDDTKLYLLCNIETHTHT